MPRSSRRAAALTLLAALCWAGGASGIAMARTASSAGSVGLTARFDRGARLGSSTAVDVRLRLDPRHLTTAPVTELRLAYPQELGLVSSGLGLMACRRPASDFEQVLVNGPLFGGCPANSIMGYGEARAVVRLAATGQVIPEYATLALLSGPIETGRLGLVVYVEGQRPFGAELAFAGDVVDAAPPYGGVMTVRMPSIPGIADLATVSLVELRMVIGSHAIRYVKRQGRKLVSYRPDGVALPATCPRGGFRFHAEVRFADGGRRSTSSTTPCPRAVAPPTR